MGMSAASFSDACATLEATLHGGARRAIIAEVSKSKSFDRSARRLRDCMRAHRFEAGELPLPAHRWVTRFDQLSRKDGFHVLHDWDGKADRFNDDMIPVEVVSFIERTLAPRDHLAGGVALSILLDYYFLYLIAALTLRAWDEGDPNVNLDEVTRLLGHLQGASGSGQQFARNAETLLLIATAHFEPEITAYEALLLKVRRLDSEHRLNVAITHAAILGCHLRFGLEVTCAGNVSALRDDNVPDYPWLCEALATLLEAYAGEKDGSRRNRVSEAILLGLLPDPVAFLSSQPPGSLSKGLDRQARIRELFAAHRSDLRRDFEGHHPDDAGYSPFAFTFNFPHNLVKGAVVDAAVRGAPWLVALDDLLTAPAKEAESAASRRSLATTLSRYALASPDTIRGRPHPAIVYHPAAGRREFEAALDRLFALG